MKETWMAIKFKEVNSIMNRVKLLFILSVLLTGGWGYGQNSGDNKIKIALVGDLMPKQELDSIVSLLKTFNNTTFKVITIKELQKLKSQNFTHLWIHKTFYDEPSQTEINCKKSILQFLNNGGNLFLSQQALFLLNIWGIENQPFRTKSDTIRDEGFGRPLGFHSFKSHPLFDGMHGGAYVNKAYKDHIIKKTGLFGNDYSIAGKSVGIEWTYITFHEDSRLVFEYRVGKGKIIAVGGFLDYSIPNFNKKQLSLFTRNVFRYTSGQVKGVKSYYWDFSSPTVKELPRKMTSSKIVASKKWQLPDLSIQLKRQEATSNFVNLAGRRILIMGQEKGGIEEIWTHPFMALSDYQVEILMKGRKDCIKLNGLKPKITISPEMIIRDYDLDGLKLREIITHSFDKPIAVMHYEWSGKKPDKIFIRQVSNLRYMWPYSAAATQNIGFSWLPGMNALLVSGQNGDISALTSFSSVPSQHKSGQADSITFSDNALHSSPTSKTQVASGFVFYASAIPTNTLNVYFIAGNAGEKKPLELFQSNTGLLNHLFLDVNAYYTSLLKNHLLIESPDTLFNDSYKWALLRTDQFLQKTPGVGTSLMAGFGTTAMGWDGNQEISGRPGYAWYFGRDGEWSGMAIDDYGDYPMVKRILKLYNDYTDLDGKILHELTSSGAVHYDAADSSPLYLILAAHYLRHSGDLEFIRSIWPGLQKTWKYILSTDTDGDGLIENTNVGHGWIEGGKLYGTHTEFYLAGCQAAAAEAMAYLADGMKNQKLRVEYKLQAANTRKLIDREFWNPSTNYFNNGKMKDGSFMNDKTVLAAVDVYLGSVNDPSKAYKTASELSSNEFTSDWGLRMVSDLNPKYNPRAYHAGMVWPLFTGWGSLSEYKTGCYTSGYLHLMQNMGVYQDWALGSIPETFSGQFYKPAGVCSQQCWSETMLLQPAIEGLLGIEPDALHNAMTISPRFPWNWNTAHVSNIRMKNALLDLKMIKSPGMTTFIIHGNSIPLKLAFSPSFPLFTNLQSVTISGKPMKFTVKNEAESVQLIIDNFELSEKMTEIIIKHTGGKGILSPLQHPIPGQESTGARVISQKKEGKAFKVIVRGIPGKTYPLTIYSSEKINELEGGKITGYNGQLTNIEVEMPQSPLRYVQKEIVVK